MSSVRSQFFAERKVQQAIFKNSIQRTDKRERRSFKQRPQGCTKSLRSSRFMESRKRSEVHFSFNSGEERQTEIELKSLILAQIERWRHALHMQVERQRGELAPWRRVAHG